MSCLTDCPASASASASTSASTRAAPRRGHDAAQVGSRGSLTQIALLALLALVSSLALGCRARPRADRPAAERAAAPPAPALAARLTAAIEAGDFPRTTSVMASQHGVLLYEGHFGGTDADTLHDVRSVTKSFTALAVGLALSRGQLRSVDDPAFAYLADLRPYAHDEPAKAQITLADLLTMSSALDCDDDEEQSPGNEENMYPQQVWARWAVALPLRASYSRDAHGRGSFAYCTAGAFLLGQILERAVGQPLDRFVEAELFAPLGVAPVRWNRSPTGEVAGSGQLRIRAGDLLKVAQLVLDRGHSGGAQLVPETWIDRMLTSYVKPSPSTDPRGIHGYGYLMWQRPYATSCGETTGWYMSGNGGIHAVVLPARDAVAVVTTTNFNTRGMHDQTARLLEEHVFSALACD